MEPVLALVVKRRVVRGLVGRWTSEQHDNLFSSQVFLALDAFRNKIRKNLMQHLIKLSFSI